EKIQYLLETFTNQLQTLYGEELQEVMLYGSYARGEANNGSDIDLMIVLKDEISFSQEIERMNVIATDVLLEYGELISLYPISHYRLQQRSTPLLMNVQKEGICIWKRS
ncbi:MAG: nucleotidyltransferase domain-containing protein, partial [SAR324 cluster bacterium]|nr:nucleotidyltransferase domain-containing protein [SAR324 cluster bacterium]